MPEFSAFYRAVHGREPFPWQARLADRVAADERWPKEIGVQTGLGKTACLDVAVWWLASQADRLPARRTAPTRIWWVVNRRLLVDSTAEHAETLSVLLSDPANPEEELRRRQHAGHALTTRASSDRLKEGLDDESLQVLSTVAVRLRALSPGPDSADPLEVIRLRGGVASRTPTDPSRPAVVLCTLPMYGSRLLFRGYGSRSRMRVVDAAMAGTDSLVLLDEAHLAPHLQKLLPALAECTPGAQAILGAARSRPVLVSLTATGDASGNERFELDDDDEAHAVVRQRLDAAKLLALRDETEDGAGKPADTAKKLAAAALDLLGGAPRPASCIVFANTPVTARAAFDRLRKGMSGGAADVLLLTGRAREREAERVRGRILDPVHGMAAGRDPGSTRERHLIVVATQTLEVGADVDAEYLVTETCGGRALTQRLGRLNRLGCHAHARAAYVHTPPPKPPRKRKNSAAGSDGWPVYGREPATVLRRLQDAASNSASRTVEVSPRWVADVLGAPEDRPGRAPEILYGLLWEWIKTTTPPAGEAPVEPYFSGIAAPDYAVSLLWRAHVPAEGALLWPRARDHEAVDVPIGEVRDALGDDGNLCRLSADGVTVEQCVAPDLRPGDQVVLPTDRGLLDDFGWNASSAVPVMDVSLPGKGVPLDADALRRLCGVSVGHLLDRVLGDVDDADDPDPAEQDEAIEEILEALASAGPPGGWEPDEWNRFVASLETQPVTPARETPRLPARDAAAEPQSSELDETSLAPAATELDLHGRAVAARARSVADRLGLDTRLADVVERAGRLHDIGKAERRFQRWLDPHGKFRIPMAKSERPRHLWERDRIAADWPRGGRHEDLSARLVRRWLDRNPGWSETVLRDLLVHLVISHHGKGRPLVPPVEDGALGLVHGVVDGEPYDVPADLAVVDWSQPARFRRLNDRFGPWGLALLEAIVITADHAISAGTAATSAEAS